MAIKVFISHKQADERTAREVSDRLRNMHGIDTYLDAVDPVIGQKGEELAKYVREQLGRCTQLLAVVSPATKDSWWVPWEIGVASEKDYPLATYGGNAVLPEFLKKWPVLTNNSDLDVYALASKAAERKLQVERGIVMDSVSRKNAAQEFYRTIRSGLRQY